MKFLIYLFSHKGYGRRAAGLERGAPLAERLKGFRLLANGGLLGGVAALGEEGPPKRLRGRRWRALPSGLA